MLCSYSPPFQQLQVFLLSEVPPYELHGRDVVAPVRAAQVAVVRRRSAYGAGWRGGWVRQRRLGGQGEVGAGQGGGEPGGEAGEEAAGEEVGHERREGVKRTATREDVRFG
eukprot:CAMPEP_0182457454 /NCGR_PEP_ID=MMETSP1319-20130603/3026_1 /TAXON_ID=172717 /ORGANISM="Bolidomonas pacifica, Strain RCC208" /LENGTH=110 /DNA_ID=CAMNT_0024655927 /DNA_START=138 /DNA_END=470 /DNA_ORIENTATION=+